MTRTVASLLLLILALLVRAWQLDWQPLWWDEGYSIYFASEPLARMVWLTSNDIHPPFYYALLHGWLRFALSPVSARLLSLLIGALTLPLFAWLATQMAPTRPRSAWFAAALLLINPLHLYYSQEVRMYGLAMALGIASTLCLWQAATRLWQNQPARRWLMLYGLCALLSLHTLYYLGFLLAAHALWMVWQFRTKWRTLWHFLLTDLFILLGFLPWLLYAGGRLTAYVEQKVGADQDRSLNLLDFISRHLAAFLTGQRAPNATVVQIDSYLSILLLFLLALATIRRFLRKKPLAPIPTLLDPVPALWAFLLVPTLCAFLINLRTPFFPENGERLLLFVLPYFLLLLAIGINSAWSNMDAPPTPGEHSKITAPPTLLAQEKPKRRSTGLIWGMRLILAGLLAVAGSGVAHFYTTPRHQADDYRPLIGQIVQQSNATDTLLATYPWQIGLWRIYAPLTDITAPQVELLSDSAVEWGTPVSQTIDRALSRGTLWFPALLSVGSTLPQQVEAYLQALPAFALENHWFSPTTRLSAWRSAAQPITIEPVSLDFSTIIFNGVTVTPTTVSSGNQPLLVTLRWTSSHPNQPLDVSLRLQDQAGHTWAQHDYRLVQSYTTEPAGFVERVGMIVPPGIPPGRYRLMVGVNRADDGQTLMLKRAGQIDQQFADVAQISVTQPMLSALPLHLPIQFRLDPAEVLDNLVLLGYSGASDVAAILAGEKLSMVLFFQNPSQSLPDRQIFVSLLNASGNGVAGSEAWPLPNYPMPIWPQGALVQVPMSFYLPATINTGEYRLVTGLIEPVSGSKSRLAKLGSVHIVQRKANFEATTPMIAFSPVRRFGNHALLLGYDWETSEGKFEVRLHWKIEQALLPPHHIFVHFDALDGETLAQIDGPPMTASGKAPTGSWQTGEFLITQHRLDKVLSEPHIIRVGLYNPLDFKRLVVTVDGAEIGDAVQLE